MSAPQDCTPPLLRIQLLGGFRVSVGSRVIEASEWRLRKAAALVKLLALAPGHRLHREQVLDLLWPDLDPNAAANNLHHVLHRTRRLLAPGSGCPYLQFQTDLLLLAPTSSIWVDVEAFEQAAASARRSSDPAGYRAALSLYPGDFLPEDLYEDWAAERREGLRSLHLSLLLELAALEEAAGRLGVALAVLQRAVSQERALEEGHRALMRLYARTGQRQQALRQYQQLRQILDQELAAEPEDETQELYEAILAGEVPSAAILPAPMTGPPVRRHNLPAALTRFIGREREIDELEELLQHNRLVTVTGVGGAGKTRLALEVAGRLIDHYPEGVWLVEFASLSDPALVPRAVATVLEVPEQPDQDPVQGLLTALQARELLLALDNCEHLVTACAQLVELLLRSCPGLRVLATSREPLRIEGERTAHILPLSLPDATRRPLVEDLLGCESVRLLVERVQFRQPSFLLTEGNGWAVSEICRKLEGIPLALELAAARAGALSVEQIAARLEDALGVLTAGSRTALSRQQTLQGALDWSYDLLSESEQRLFCRLAVFAGGWDLEAAEAMADRREEALDLLSRLVDKSLVVTEVEGEAVRFRLLEPIRQYAELRLRQSGDAEEAHRRHAACYLRLAERARPLLFGPDQEVWLDRLEAEQDNMRAALSRYHSEIGEARTVLRLASKLWPFWSVRYPHEGGSWLEAALTEAQDAAPPDRAEALQGAAIIAYWQRDYDRAAAHGEEGLELYRGLHDLQGAAACLNTLGMVAMERGELQPATKLFEEALDLYRQAGDRLGMADALGNLGCLTNELGDLQRALVLSEESLALCREVGDPLLIAAAVANVGATARELGECGRALECFGEAVRISHKLGEQRHTAFCLEGIALTLCRLQSWWLSA